MTERRPTTTTATACAQRALGHTGDTRATTADSAGPALVAIGGKRPRERAFANDDVLLPSWFALATTQQLKRNSKKPLRVQAAGQQIVLWRDADGEPHAFEARCPHLGADLGFGSIVEGQLRCAYHHWRFRGDGSCARSATPTPSMRCAKVFPVVERHGLVFVYPAAGTPAMPFPSLPDGDDERDYWRIVLPQARAPVHHHLATSHALDPVHFEGLHGRVALSPWRHDVDEDAFAVHLHVHLRHEHALVHALLGELRMRFSSHGPSLMWATATTPAGVKMHALFYNGPHEGGGTSSRGVLFIKKGSVLRSLKVVASLTALLWQDRQMIEALKTFRPAYIDSDAPLRDFHALIERWPRP